MIKGHQILTKDQQGIWLSYTKRKCIPQATDSNKKRILKDVSPAEGDIKCQMVDISCSSHKCFISQIIASGEGYSTWVNFTWQET